MNERNGLTTSFAPQKYDFVVIGGSLPGMAGAFLLKKRHPKATVVIIENGEQLGGNLIGHNALGDHFDAGTHILQEIGDKEIDELIEDAVDYQCLVKLDSSVGDYAATIRDKKVYSATSFPDVLARSPFVAKKILDEIMEMQKQCGGTDLGNTQQMFKNRRMSAHDASMSRFGPTATNEIIMPILAEIFGRPRELSAFAIEFCTLMRLCLVGKEDWAREVHSSGLQDRIAFPDQQNLPDHLRHARKSVYSSKNGAKDFVLGLSQRCEQAGIRILTSTSVRGIKPHSKSLTVDGPSMYKAINYGQLISCVGVAITQKLITGNPGQSKKSITYRIMHFHLRKDTKSQICYYYSQQTDSAIFRVTNYSAFSGRDSDHRLTVETIGKEHLSDEELLVAVEKELVEVGIIDSDVVQSSVCMKSKNAFPNPSLETFEQFLLSERYVKEFESEGLMTCGIGSANGVFFQNEILRHVVSQIRINF